MPKDDTFDTSDDAMARSMAAMADDADPDTMSTQGQQRLKSFIERWERLIGDRAAVMEDIKELRSEAKGEGFDTKIMAKVIAIRAKDKVKRDEEEALIDLYLSAIGGL